ncbi:MAG: SpoIIE family protein phosphatase [Clostridia bacterium]|nr:SpoIIE family protein phosphatase [Clostridia bacterium]
MYKTRNIKKPIDSEQLIKYTAVSFLKQGVTALAGFLASTASVASLAPFGVSLSAAVYSEYMPACVLGCAAGYFYTYGATVLTLRYIAAAAIAGIIAYIFKRNFQRNYQRWFSAASAFLSVFSTGLIISLSVTLSAEEILIYALEGGAAATTGWFFDRFLNIDTSKKFAARLTGSETTAILVAFGIALLALNSFPLYIFSPAVIFGSYAVLVCATYGGDKYGSLSGILAGIVLGLSGNGSFVTGGISLGGLLSGIFSKCNRFIASVIFIICVSVTAISTDDWLSASYIIYDVGIACLLFVLTPKKIKNVYSAVFSLSADGVYLSGQRNVLKMRLHTAADGLSEVAGAVKAIGGIYRKKIIPDKNKIYENTCVNVCRDCEKYNYCYGQNLRSTQSAFEQITESIRYNENGEVRIPEFFTNTCTQTDEIVKNLYSSLQKYRNAMREVSKTGETVNIVSDQFFGVADFLSQMSGTIDSCEAYDPNLSELAAELLKNDMDLPTVSCGIFKTAENHIYGEICFDAKTVFNADMIAKKLSEAIERTFEEPVIHKLSDGTKRVCIYEKTIYRVISGSHQISADSAGWCGDTFDSFFDGRGNFCLLLSDGMGTGKKAAADSVMCCSLAAGMLRSGFAPDAILKMINAAMLVRSGEESIATLDIAQIDLYNGNVRFFKAGAGFSIAMKHLKMLKIEKPSLPVGILRQIEFEKIELQLHDGDALVLMTDGVTQEAVTMWREILKSATDYDDSELADKLAKTAHLNMPQNETDDITVVTATIVLNEA